MATGDVTITRGIQARDDYLDANVTQLLGGTSQSNLSATTDGDTVEWSGTFTNPTPGDFAAIYRPLSPNVATLSSYVCFWRAKFATLATNYSFAAYIHYTNSSSQVNSGNNPPTGNSFTISTFNTPQLTADRIGIIVTANTGAATANFDVFTDFVFICKENLTLPAASQPLSLPLSKRIAALQIPNREGDITQVLGSSSPTLEVDGTLLTTTSPNNYTGDQWWDVMVGTWLEGNWQWFASDRVAYKYLITDLIPQQDPGRVGYYAYRMKLRKIDIISATAQTFSSNNNPPGAIQ